MSERQRADKVLVELELVKSRSKASELIEQGKVTWRGERVSKPSQLITQDDLEIHEENFYVGRGALKFESAIQSFGLSLEEKVVCDIGASTGGFTQYCLKAGASQVYAVDVGTGQLATELREDPRVINLEGQDIRTCPRPTTLVDLCVIDVSFISLKQVLEPAKSWLRPDGELIALVKPQFEVGSDFIGKGGVVKDRNQHLRVMKELEQWCYEHGLYLKKACVCGLRGKKKGNQEYFFYLTQTPVERWSDFNELIQQGDLS